MKENYIQFYSTRNRTFITITTSAMEKLISSKSHDIFNCNGYVSRGYGPSSVWFLHRASSADEAYLLHRAVTESESYSVTPDYEDVVFIRVPSSICVLLPHLPEDCEFESTEEGWESVFDFLRPNFSSSYASA